MNHSDKIRISFGCLAPPLKEQIPNLLNADHYQKLADSISLLKVHGVLTNSQVRKAEFKLVKKIEAAMVGVEGK